MIKSSSSPSSSSSSLRALRSLYAAGATSRLMTGYTALLARNLPLTAVQFPLYEGLAHWIRSWRQRQRQRRGQEGGRRRRRETPGILETGLVAALSAAVAGAVAAWVTTPSDVVKTRTMLLAATTTTTTTTTEAQDTLQRQGQNPWQVARQIYREKGLRGLFRGGGLRSAWTAVGSGLYLGTYDAAKLWLSGEQEEEEDGSLR